MKSYLVGVIVAFGVLTYGFNEPLANAFTPPIKVESKIVDLTKIDNVRSIVNESINDHYYDDISKYAPMIIKKAKKLKVPVHLALALVKRESQFNPKAINYNTNGTTDCGLMQLNTSTFEECSQKELFDPEINVDLGLGYLREMYDRLGNWKDAVTAYNAGPFRVENKNPPQVSISYTYDILNIEQEFNIDYLKIHTHA